MSHCVFDLNIERVSAVPDVWFPSQDVYLSICAFGEYRTTRRVTPVFPLIFHESFRFEKSFYAACDSVDVSRRLEDERIEIELLQYDRYYDGVIKLASFAANAREFLFPYPSLSPSHSSASKEIVLFKSFVWQGLSPRLEFSVRTNISRDSPISSRVVCYGDRLPLYSNRYTDEVLDLEVEELTSRVGTSYLSTPRLRPRPRSASASYSTYRARSPAPLLTASDKLEIELAAERARAKARADALLSIRRSTTPVYRRSYDDTYLSTKYPYYPRYYY